MTINTEFGKITGSKETLRDLYCELCMQHDVMKENENKRLAKLEHELLDALCK